MLGISRQRVQQIYRKATSPQLSGKQNTFESVLSERAKNGIRKFFSGTIPGPEELAGAGVDKIKMIDNIGSKSIKELANVLHKHGYIGNLAGKKSD